MRHLDLRVRPGTSPRRTELARQAAGLFAERGFHGVTMDDIGSACGVSGPALYHHFSSKEALLEEMLTSISEWLLDQATTITRHTADPSAALDALVRAHVAFALDETSLITVQHRDLVHVSSSQVRRLQRAYVELWVEQLVRLRPGATEGEARAAVHAAIGLINSTPHSARLSRDAMEQLLHRMAGAALDAV
jgi:AcrR family transcriptional regulator